MISQREIRKIFLEKCKDKECNYELSKNVIIDVIQLTQTQMNELINDLVNELDQVNRLREIQYLQKLKRITPSILKNVLDKHNKHTTDLNNGKLGDLNKDTNFFEAVEVA